MSLNYNYGSGSGISSSPLVSSAPFRGSFEAPPGGGGPTTTTSPTTNSNRDSNTTPATFSTIAGTKQSRSTAGLMGGSTRASQRSVASSAVSHSSRSHRTLQFFRYILGQRNADYCSDAPPPAPDPATTGAGDGTTARAGPSRTGPSVRSLISMGSFSGGGFDANGNPVPVPAWKRTLCCLCMWPAADRKHFLLSILHSRPWRVMLLVLTFILLFGSEIQNTVIPASGDTACDVVYTITFVIFWIDIFMRIDAEPNYFAFNLFGFPGGDYPERDIGAGVVGHSGVSAAGVGASGSGGVNTSATEGDASSLRSSNIDAHRQSGSCCGIEIGSFLFWCDVVSTLTLLHEISFIDKANFSEVTVAIILNEYGIPETGLNSLNAASPVETEVDLLVTIGKTARVARFIRSSTAIKISSRVNWDWFVNIVNPFWWCRLCRHAIRPPKDLATSNASSRNEYDTYRSGMFGTIRSSERRPTILRNSWGGVNIGMIAAAKVERAKAEKRQDVLSVPKRFLTFVGVLPPETDELLRQVAAIKIQRAWRRVVAKGFNNNRQDKRMSERSAAAWSGRDVSNPVDRALQKRSFLARYTNVNGTRLKNSALVGSQASGRGRNRLIPLGSKKNATKNRNESQVGSAMRELTGQRVALGIILALLLTVLFTYVEKDATWPTTMVVLYNQTANPEFADKSLNAARNSSVQDLYYYQLADGSTRNYSVPELNGSPLRPREIYRVTVKGQYTNETVGLFAYRSERKEQEYVSLLSTFFILIVWFSGVTAFAGPVMVLVVIPIERMVRLLGMLMVDPLGYENSPRYKRFIEEEDTIAQNTRWTKEVLKGMETSFLMSTILRIGSLMKVGFGSAGVEIIRNHLEKGQNKNMLMLSEKGSSVSCIFLFCDIRQFTDATECLQEEVFVFTNRIAAVVHSYTHAYGGSANKNIGDAFLCSWLLDEEPSSFGAGYNGFSGAKSEEHFTANTNQADKALYAVVKISMALHYDDFYIETLSEGTREALRSKLSKRKGPIVQMGFGLHAGKAVQGAIGSQRKIDATYVSEHVDRAEFLESSTKQYGVTMLMSDSFHRLLHPSNRRRCRKVDQILIQDEEDAEDDYVSADGKIIELLTFDMYIEALWKDKTGKKGEGVQESDSEKGSEKGSKREGMRGSGGMALKARRRSMLNIGGLNGPNLSDEFSEGFGSGTPINQGAEPENASGPRPLTLPTGPALYSANVWVDADMRKIRMRYLDGLFFQKFNSGLQAYYARDWEHAKQCFLTILDLFEDGPSRYFLNQIEKNKGIPPRDFKGYGIA